MFICMKLKADQTSFVNSTIILIMEVQELFVRGIVPYLQILDMYIEFQFLKIFDFELQICLIKLPKLSIDINERNSV